MAFHPRYKAGWVHRDICNRLEKFSRDIDEGKSPRLMLLMPPRHGKSQLASKLYPAWHLGHYPHHEFIGCSYNIPLALDFSREVRDVIKSEKYNKIFPKTKLNEDFQSAEAWRLQSATGVGAGGYNAAGIGGGITGKGAHCLVSGTIVSTPTGGKTIDFLYETGGAVNTPMGQKRIMAATKNTVPTLYKLTTTTGKSIIGTGEHPMYMPGKGAYLSLKELYGQTKSTNPFNLSVVLEGIPASEVRSNQDGETRTQRHILQQRVQPEPSRSEECKEVQNLRAASNDRGELSKRGILLNKVQAESEETSGQNLSGMQRGVSAKNFKAGLLQQPMFRQSAQSQNARFWEFPLQGRQLVRFFVRPDASDSKRAGSSVRNLWNSERSELSPHRRGHTEQYPGEPDNALPNPPHNSSQVQYDSISSVEVISGGTYTVYDLQIEDAGCFFAGQILTGNCLIIDDPIKNAEEADSSDLRQKIWNWYLTSAYTRLAPGGGVLIIMTSWSDDDLAGRLQREMKEDPEADQFEVVKYPAIAEEDEKYRLKGEALHPERFTLEMLNKTKRLMGGTTSRYWSALYQQNPVSDEGAYFTDGMFKHVDELPQIKDMDIYQAWDFAISEKQHNDFTVGTTIGVDSDDNMYVIEVVRIKTNDAAVIIEAVLDMYQRYPHIKGFGAEDSQIWRTLRKGLERRAVQKKIYIHLDEKLNILKPVSDKMVRARPLQARMSSGKVFFPRGKSWYDDVKTEFLRFPAGIHDDIVDSLAWNTQLLSKSGPPPPVKYRGSSRELTLEQKLLRLNRGNGSISHMSS